MRACDTDHSTDTAARMGRQGFTLVELAIVLVIIGLLIGGVLTGRELLSVAATRSQLRQIDTFNAAANTFRTKYGYLPGDLPPGPATQYNFATRAGLLGRGDGDGMVAGICEAYCGGNNYPNAQASGETPLFWNDLVTAKMIPGQFYGGDFGQNPHITLTTQPLVKQWLPEAKIGQGNYVYVWSINNVNYYGMSAVTIIAHHGPVGSTSGLTVQQAADMDEKVDDRAPQSGTALAQALTSGTWVAAGSATGVSPGVAATASATSCYDNGGVATKPMAYSLALNQDQLNCALSFRVQ